MKPHILRWHEADLAVRAGWVPRYLWFTASIEVFVAGERVLRTGGRFKLVGSVTNCFDHDGTSHEATLSWGLGGRRGFPYELTIDGECLANSRVVVENWWAAWIRNAVCLLICGLSGYLDYMIYRKK